jgi:hypothetical protein
MPNSAEFQKAKSDKKKHHFWTVTWTVKLVLFAERSWNHGPFCRKPIMASFIVETPGIWVLMAKICCTCKKTVHEKHSSTYFNQMMSDDVVDLCNS